MVAMSEQTSTVQGRARAANVNLNIPARQAVQKINVPERSRGELDVDVNKIFKGVVDGIGDYQEKKVEKGLNNYAREVNKIAEGINQGAHSAEAAEGKLRQLDDTYLAQGYKAEDLANIRAKYDGGVYTARSAVLKEKEMHEAKRRLEVADTFRKTYQFSSQWSDERVLSFVDGINRVHDELVATNKALESPNMSAEDRAAMTRVRNDQFERLGMENTMMQLNLRLESNKPLTAEEVAMFRQNFMAEARRNQIPLEVAAVMSDRMLDASGMSTIMELQKQNADNITEYNKKITDSMMQTAKLGIYMSFPQAAILDAMSPEMRSSYMATPDGTNALRVISAQVMPAYNNKTESHEKPKTTLLPAILDVATNTARYPSQYPATVLSNSVSLATNTVGDYNQESLIDMSTPSDVKTVHYNAEAIQRRLFSNPNVLKVLATMSPEQKKQFEKSGRFNMAISEWTALMPDFVLDAKKMFNSLGTSRLRVNDEGLLVMSDDVTGSAKGFWQTTGNILGAFHSDIDEHIAGVNEFLSANLKDPEERKEFIKMISGGHDIQDAGTFEVTEDNYRSVTGNIGDIGSAVGGAFGDWMTEADERKQKLYEASKQKREQNKKTLSNSFNIVKDTIKDEIADMVLNKLFGSEETLEHPDSDIVPDMNGNISLKDREKIDVGNGEFGTEQSITVEADGKHFVIPTIYKDEDGVTRQHSNDEADKHFKSTGEYLHVADTAEEADKMAIKIHNRFNNSPLSNMKNIGETFAKNREDVEGLRLQEGPFTGGDSSILQAVDKFLSDRRVENVIARDAKQNRKGSAEEILKNIDNFLSDRRIENVVARDAKQKRNEQSAKDFLDALGRGIEGGADAIKNAYKRYDERRQEKAIAELVKAEEEENFWNSIGDFYAPWYTPKEQELLDKGYDDFGITLLRAKKSRRMQMQKEWEAREKAFNEMVDSAKGQIKEAGKYISNAAGKVGGFLRQVFTEEPESKPTKEIKLGVKEGVKLANKYLTNIKNAKDSFDFIDKLSEKGTINSLENTMTKAMLMTESSGDPLAVSPKGAKGLMQIMPKTWNGDIAPVFGWKPEDINDPKKNILGGYYYFSMLKNKYKDIDKALAAYNWGQGNVDDAVEEYGNEWEQHLPEETSKYLDKVLKRVQMIIGNM